MKHFTLFSALLFSACLMAQPNYLWNELFTGSAHGNKVQNNINEIRFNAQGEAFIGGYYGSLNKDERAELSLDKETFMGYTYESQAYYAGNTFHKNFVVVKLDANQAPLWTVYTINGEYTNGNIVSDLCPTRDGGVVALMKMRYSEGDAKLADGTTPLPLAWIVDAQKDTTRIGFTADKRAHQGVIARFDRNGKLTAVKTLNVDYAKSNDAFSLECIAEDKNGNLFIVGTQTADFTYDGQTLAAGEKNSFVLKVNAELGYVKHLSTTGTAKEITLRGIQYANDALYLYGTAGNQAEQTVTFGGKSITLANALNFVTIKLDTDLTTAEYLTQTTTVKYNNVNNFMYYGMTMAQDSKSFYFTGGMVGGILFNGDTIKAVGTKGGAYNGVVLQFNADNGQLMNYYLREDATTLPADGNYYGWTVAQSGDSLYIPHWKMKEQHIDRFDKDLHFVERTMVAEATTASTLFAAADYKGLLLMSIRAGNSGACYVDGIDIHAREQNPWFAILTAYQLPVQKDTPSALDETAVQTKARKVLLNGQIIIRRGNEQFNLLGQPIR